MEGGGWREEGGGGGEERGERREERGERKERGARGDRDTYPSVARSKSLAVPLRHRESP